MGSLEEARTIFLKLTDLESKKQVEEAFAATNKLPVPEDPEDAERFNDYVEILGRKRAINTLAATTTTRSTQKKRAKTTS